ncbi:peptide chain release factor 1 [Cumulibacter soli]|uniref:peptide chain release factor 1 n=1 Tax=Cumulibacter soli TaxID=2546344 RepID=UPI001068C05E|nr:peptide chain release factor 1 [Cumulibacter soli]
MSAEGLDTLSGLIAEHADVQEQLSDPAVHSDQVKARELGKRFAQLGPIVAAARQLEQTREDLTAARELAEEDAAFAEEATALAESIAEQEQKLRTMLLPRDPNDDKDIIMEIKAGEGGEESALFAGDLLRMYQRYAERNRWKFEMIDSTLSDLGGYKDVSIAIKMRGQAEDGAGIWQRLKHEGGVHRVQRVPVTESQGRIHTSAAGVLVYPEAEEVDIEINQNDLRIDVYRSSGPGGQSVNTTDSAVRITHEPTGIVVSCQNEKSQLQNKESAMRILRARLLADAQEKANAEASDMRKNQVRTVDRSERVRTYNFPENRISDHRSGFKAYNLDVVLDGELDPVVDSLIEMETAELLKGAAQ